MTSAYELPKNTWIVYKRRGKLEFAQIQGKDTYEIGRVPPSGSAMYQCTSRDFTVQRLAPPALIAKAHAEYQERIKRAKPLPIGEWGPMPWGDHNPFENKSGPKP